MNDEQINKLLDSLSKTKFRGSFHLNKKMKAYTNSKGMDEIETHAYDFVNTRLKPMNPKNDGKQTPMRQVHPVFIAQHATGCCCRGCLARIHNIPKDKTLTNEEIDYIVKVLITWIKREIES